MIKARATSAISGSVWRHRKGGLYTVIAIGIREADRSADVIYRCRASGTLYTRPASEFFDGRFKRVGRTGLAAGMGLWRQTGQERH